MPNFQKLHEHAKPIKSNVDLTVPVCFDLKSEKFHLKALDLKMEKLRQAEEEEQAKRKFKAKLLPDFNSLQPVIMPSQKSITVAVKPKFASDFLPQKPKEKENHDNRKNQPRDFVF